MTDILVRIKRLFSLRQKRGPDLQAVADIESRLIQICALIAEEVGGDGDWAVVYRPSLTGPSSDFYIGSNVSADQRLVLMDSASAFLRREAVFDQPDRQHLH